MSLIALVLLVFSLVLFTVATFTAVPRFNLLAAGLAFLVAASLASGLPVLD